MVRFSLTSCQLWRRSDLCRANLNADYGGNLIEIIDRIIFNVPLPSCITDDVDYLYVLRFDGQNARLIGYRSSNTFRAIFVDVDLSTYEH